MVKMVVVVVRDEGDVDHLRVVASGDGVLVGKGNARCKTGSVMIILPSSLQIRLTCPSQINLPFLRAFASNFKFGKGLAGSLPFGGKSAWIAKFNIDACGLFFTISIVGSKFIKTLPLKFGEALYQLLALGIWSAAKNRGKIHKSKN